MKQYESYLGIGDFVKIIDLDCEGLVIGVLFSQFRLDYPEFLVEYFINGERKSDYFNLYHLMKTIKK